MWVLARHCAVCHNDVTALWGVAPCLVQVGELAGFSETPGGRYLPHYRRHVPAGDGGDNCSVRRAPFLGAFAKLRKVAFSIVVSVPTEQLGIRWTDFRQIRYLSIFRESVHRIHVSLKQDTNNRYFT